MATTSGQDCHRASDRDEQREGGHAVTRLGLLRSNALDDRSREEKDRDEGRRYS
jgi:hypothetical protein